MDSSSTPLSSVIKLAQKTLEPVPVIVLGSGASAQYGIGGMGALSKHLLADIKPTAANEKDVWTKFAAELTRLNDLEAALHSVTLPEALESRVVRSTRHMLLGNDLDVQGKLAERKIEFALSKLLRHLLRSTHRQVQIVTTNYDRLAEYACDQAEIPHFTGFLGGYFKSYQSLAEPKSAFGDTVVEILKVHGSLDWFMNANQNVFALPDSQTVPPEIRPVMVTPGTGKYAATHDEPFRTIIGRSDIAFAKARAILCIGYGFNDHHIQPKLMNRVHKEQIPVVVLARTLTPKTRDFIAGCKHPHFLALEMHDTGAIAYTCEQPKGFSFKEPLWELNTFLQHVI